MDKVCSNIHCLLFTQEINFTPSDDEITIVFTFCSFSISKVMGL